MELTNEQFEELTELFQKNFKYLVIQEDNSVKVYNENWVEQTVNIK